MSKSVTKDRRHSLPAHTNRGIMRFSFVSVRPFRAFVSDLDTIGPFLSRVDWPSGPLRRVAWAEGSLLSAEDIRHRRVQFTSPRTRWPSPDARRVPAGRHQPPTVRDISAGASGGVYWGYRVEEDGEDGGPAVVALTHAQATVHGLHTAPRPLHARPEEPRQRRGRRSSLCPCGAETNPIWSILCRMLVDVEMAAHVDVT